MYTGYGSQFGLSILLIKLHKVYGQTLSIHQTGVGRPAYKEPIIGSVLRYSCERRTVWHRLSVAVWSLKGGVDADAVLYILAVAIRTATCLRGYGIL